MQLSVYSWTTTDLAETTSINNTTDYAAWYDAGQALWPSRTPIYSERSNKWKKLAGVSNNDTAFVFKIQCLGTFHSQRETVKGWFNPDSYVLGTLKFKDTADSNRQWYVKGYPVSVIEETPGRLSITLALDEPYLRTVSDSTGVLSVAASSDTVNLTVLGNLNARPRITIQPTIAKAGDYNYSRWVAVYNTQNTSFTNYPFDFGGIDTSALIAANKMQSDGKDLRLRIRGVEVARWFGTTDGRGINTTDTAVWANIDLHPATYVTLAAAIDDVATEMEVDVTAMTPAMIDRLRTAPYKCLYVENEAMTFVNFSWYTRMITGLVRGVNGTSAASHAANTRGDLIQFPSFLVYGSSDITTAQTVNDKFKPMIDLHSTNTLWYYSNFWASSDAGRSAQWTPDVIYPTNATGKLSTFYTKTQASDTDPATVMGCSIKAYTYQGKWQTDNATVYWDLNHPAGVTTVEATGSKYRYDTSWPATASGLQYFNKLTRQYTNIDKQATPSSDKTWTAFTIESTDTGALPVTAYRLRFVLAGSVTGSANNAAHIEFDNLQLGLNPNGVPTKFVSDELSNYRINARITNTTTGDYITVNLMTALNEVTTIDCDNKTITTTDGDNKFSAMGFSTIRPEWFDLKPGVNTIKYVEAGTSGVTLGFSWENRNTL